MLGIIQEAMIAERRAQVMAFAAMSSMAKEGDELTDARQELADLLETAESSMVGGRDLGSYAMLSERLGEVGGDRG